MYKCSRNTDEIEKWKQLKNKFDYEPKINQ